MASLLTASWLKKLAQYRRLIIGFSGGLDSTVLLHNLLSESELKTKLLPVHLNHGLSPHSFSWQNHCLNFCDAMGLALIIKELKFKKEANIEANARKARYEAFSRLLKKNDALILAHHLDDQAETLLLQLFRGAGISGLAAMPEEKKLADTVLLRPLLGHTRQTLEHYAESHQLKWIEDESNLDCLFTRNYMRHQILPVLTSRWPGIVNNLARTAMHCQQAQSNLEALAKIDCPDLARELPLSPLKSLDPARLSNILRFWFKLHEVTLPETSTFNRLIKELIFARGDATPQVNWKEFSVRRYQQKLYLIKARNKPHLKPQLWSNFPEPYSVEGLGTLIAKNAKKGFILPKSALIEIRFRQGGELFNWHGQTKRLKKLMQDWQIPPWLREQIPLLYVEGQLALVVGYAISDLFYHESESQKLALQIDFF